MAQFLSGRDAVRAYLTEKGEPFEEMEQGFILPASLGAHGATTVNVVWEERPGIVHLVTPMPFEVPPTHRRDLLEAMAQINTQLVVGAFVLLPRLAFVAAAHLNHDGSISDAVLDRLVHACRVTAARFVEPLAQVCLPPVVPRPAVTIGARKLSLDPGERALLAAAVERDWGRFAPRLAGRIDVSERLQPWWPRHRVLEVSSPAPMPATMIHVAVTPSGGWRVLRGHPEVISELARVDRPAQLADAEQARAYASICTSWTTDAQWGELTVAAFDEIPFREELSAAERELVKELRMRHAADLHAPALVAREDGWIIESWVVSQARLIHRRVTVGQDGQLGRADTIVASSLPVPPGKAWGLVNGRYVPVG
jgi:hypothetical protein